jgi:hypothetical protein
MSTPMRLLYPRRLSSFKFLLKCCTKLFNWLGMSKECLEKNVESDNGTTFERVFIHQQNTYSLKIWVCSFILVTNNHSDYNHNVIFVNQTVKKKRENLKTWGRMRTSL